MADRKSLLVSRKPAHQLIPKDEKETLLLKKVSEKMQNRFASSKRAGIHEDILV
jgi:hypothetical protein